MHTDKQAEQRCNQAYCTSPPHKLAQAIGVGIASSSSSSLCLCESLLLLLLLLSLVAAAADCFCWRCHKPFQVPYFMNS